MAEKIKCKYCGRQYSRNGIRMHELSCAFYYVSTDKTTDKTTDKESHSVSTRPVLTKQLGKTTGQNVSTFPVLNSSTDKSTEKQFDPEYDLIKVEAGVWQCEHCKVYLDEIESRCPNCGARFQ